MKTPKKRKNYIPVVVLEVKIVYDNIKPSIGVFGLESQIKSLKGFSPSDDQEKKNKQRKGNVIKKKTKVRSMKKRRRIEKYSI